jgi:hypothetical protein
VSSSALRIAVAGSVASASRQAGAASAVLQYMLGLRDLGHDVWFVDQLSPESGGGRSEVKADVAFCRQVMAGAGFKDRFAVFEAPGGSCLPLSRDQVCNLAASTDLLLNLSGRLTDADLLDRIPVRVFVDLDPGFNQLWAQGGIDMNFDRHTHFATVGLAIGNVRCPVPLSGRSWITICPPVVLGAWPARADPPARGFTTIANWRSYGPASDGDLRLGLKAHSFRKLLELPRLATGDLSVALQIDLGDSADLAALRAGGWIVLDGAASTATVEDYRSFIGSSTGEIAVAKEGYVVTRCGWFSERSAAYLASGRPVVAQSTGFEDYVPTGAGLMAFGSAEEAADGINEARSRYRWHADRAREIAETHFAADRVLGQMLNEVYATRGATKS